MELVDPWGGMKQGMSQYIETLRDVGNKRRYDAEQERKDRLERATLAQQAEEAEYRQAKMKQEAYEIEEKSINFFYGITSSIKDDKSYKAAMHALNSMAERLPDEKTKAMLKKKIAEFPARWDGTFEDGSPNPNSIAMQKVQQAKMSLMAQKKALGQEKEKLVTIIGKNAKGERTVRTEAVKPGETVTLGEGEQLEDEFKEGLKTPASTSKTIYGPDGQTKIVPVKKGEEYTPPEGWSLKPPSDASSENYDKNLLVAAQVAGVDPKKVKSGELTQEEATKVAEAYAEQFGTMSLVQMLMKTAGTPESAPKLKFDEKGNLVQ